MVGARTLQAGIVWVVTLAAVVSSHVAASAVLRWLDITAVVALLLVGLPHGALDLIELRADPRLHSRRAAIPAVYLLLLGAVALTWWIDARLALIAFLLLSIVHFAGEWQEDLPALAAWPAAALVVAAPAATRASTVGNLFTALSGDPALAARLVTVAGLAALPFASALAGALIVKPARWSEVAILLALGVAASALEPLPAFAIFFAAVHSPRHLAQTAAQLGWTTEHACRRAWPMTLASLVIFAFMLGVGRLQSGTASFLLLAVLAVPHMFAKPILRAWEKYALPPVEPSVSRWSNLPRMNGSRDGEGVSIGME